MQFGQQWSFESLYQNRHLYRLASTLPFEGRWRDWQNLVLSRLHGNDIFELGCGTGDLLLEMIKLRYNCNAIDQSAEMVDAARSMLKKRRYDDFRVTKGQAQSLPFSSASFDTVVSTFPNEYILDPITISQIERVLRPGGLLIVVFTWNPPPIGSISLLSLLFHLFTYGPAVFFRTDEEVKQQIEKKMRHLLEEHGLRYRNEVVNSQDWKIFIVSGEKPKP